MMDANHRNLIAELGLDKLSPEKQAEALLQIDEAIYQVFMAKVLARISEEDKAELEGLLREAKEDEVAAFLEKKLPDFDRLAEEAVEEFKQEASEILRLPRG